MSIRWRDGRPIVEVYNPATRKKQYVKPADYGMSFRGLEGRALERAARKLEGLALEACGNSKVGDETCDSFAGRWVDDFPRSEQTNVQYRERVKLFAEDFKGRSLRSITRDEARAWAKKHPGRLSVVRTMYSDALDERLVGENPFAKIKQPAREGRKNIIVLTRDEVDALADTAREVHGAWGEEFAALILWAAYTCMRPAEIYDMRWSLLDGDVYDLRTQFNTRLRRSTEPKHGSVGEVFVPEPALRAIKGLPRHLDDLVFHGPHGQRMQHHIKVRAWHPVRDTFVAQLPRTHQLRQRLLVDPKDKLDLYELRHFGASYLLNDLGLEPYIVAQQLRHRRERYVLDVYGHPDRRRAIDRIRSAWGENVRRLEPGSGEVSGEGAGEAR